MRPGAKPCAEPPRRRFKLVAAGSFAVLLLGWGGLAHAQGGEPQSAQSAGESRELNWIPAITIQADDINLALDEERSDKAPYIITDTSDLRRGGVLLTLTPEPAPGSSSSPAIGAGGDWQLLGGRHNETGRISVLNALAPEPRTDRQPEAGLGLGWQLNLGTQQPGRYFRLAAADIPTPLQTAAYQQPLANIHCAESTLTSQSYTASGCRFTVLDQRQIAFSLDWSPLPQLRTTASLFDARQNGPAAWQGREYTRRQMTNATLGLAGGNDVLGTLGQNLSGVQLGLEYNLLSGVNEVDIRAEWSRILDLQFDTRPLQGGTVPGLAPSEPLDNVFGNYSRIGSDLDSARLQINWSNGSFSSGLESIYQQTPLVPGISRGDDLTTFNLHFTWHTPWHGALSIGANNLLDSGAAEAGELNPAEDSINSIYGRIPYVRYKQDL